MNWEVFNSFAFFFPQILLGAIVGVLLSIFGSFLVLRNMSFLGLTLAQVVSSGVAVSLFLGLEGEWFAILFSLIIISPLVSSKELSNSQNDTLLGVLFVFFASFSQFLLSMGGNVKNQIMASYFGDILTNQINLTKMEPILLALSFLFFLLFYKKFLFLSFDKEEFIVRNYSIFFYEMIFYTIAIVLVSIAIHLLGSFYATAHLLVPSFVALSFVRSMSGLLLFSAFISFCATVVGFGISLIGFPYHEEVIYFPTSSTIVILLAGLGLGLKLLKKR